MFWRRALAFEDAGGWSLSSSSFSLPFSVILEMCWKRRIDGGIRALLIRSPLSAPESGKNSTRLVTCGREPSKDVLRAKEGIKQVNEGSTWKTLFLLQDNIRVTRARHRPPTLTAHFLGQLLLVLLLWGLIYSSQNPSGK